MYKKNIFIIILLVFLDYSSLLFGMDFHPTEIQLVSPYEKKESLNINIKKIMRLKTPSHDKVIVLSDLILQAPLEIRNPLNKESFSYRWYPSHEIGCFPFDNKPYTPDQACAQFISKKHMPNIVEQWKEKSLLVAVQKNNIPWILFLLQHNANPQKNQPSPPLQHARSVIVAKLLCNYKATIDTLPHDHISSITLHSDPDLITFFAQKGLDVNFPNKQGITPLQKSLSCKRLDRESPKAIRKLLEAGACIFPDTGTSMGVKKLLEAQSNQLENMPSEQSEIAQVQSIITNEQTKRKTALFSYLNTSGMPLVLKQLVYDYYDAQ